MSFWGRLFGSAEATKEAVGAVRDGLDALWYTKEEKAADQAAEVTEARRVLLEWVKNSQGQNLARRVLAFAIAAAWLSFKFVGVCLSVVALWLDRVDAEKLREAADLVGEFSGDMTPAVMLILGFYFAGPHMGRIAEAALVRFGDRNSKTTKPPEGGNG